LGLSLFAFLSLFQGAGFGSVAVADMYGEGGDLLGSVKLYQTRVGVFLAGDLNGLPPGWHAFHIHEHGSCDHEVGFSTAGSHFSPFGNEHGFLNPLGPHAGDMPNIYADEQGVARIELLNPLVSLLGYGNGVVGKSLMVHADPDDYVSDPAGNAGPRIACGVINKA
jgi:Cu-Zn family superoxide dismutase